MTLLKSLTILILIYCLMNACQAPKAITNNYYKTISDLPDDIWLSDLAKSRIDSVFMLANQAHNKLANHDTLGSELNYEFAFETLSHFTEEERITLTNWAKYDSVLKLMNNDYEMIYSQQIESTEAEEIREDITNLEEELFPDSILFSSMTVIDSSGDFPITLNNKVRAAIKYFQTKGRPVYSRWLERSGRYENIINEIFEERGIPAELKYLAMIESGFNPSARSYARAVGMWQFISATGKFYGLRQNWWFDERRDYIKATQASAQHLHELYQQFDGEWYLALAGYNCNPKRVKGNMRRYNTTDFWKLKRLPRQTRNYVPTFLAAAIIARDPKKFGFYVEKLKPLEVDTVLISESIDLNVIANAVDTTYEYIKKINPAVLRWVTPPGVKDFTVYLPKNKRGMFKQEYAKIPDTKKRSWVRHKIRSGETLSTIARKYKTNINVLKSTNKIVGTRIRAGRYLLIPVPQNKKHFYVTSYPVRSNKKIRSKKKSTSVKENLSGYKLVKYLVKKGDTLGEIAENYSTSARKIRSWNGLYYGEHIFPKQVLKIYVPGDSKQLVRETANVKKITDSNNVYYTVKVGDTLWDISRKYKITVSQLKKMNRMNGSRIRPGDRLKVAVN